MDVCDITYIEAIIMILATHNNRIANTTAPTEMPTMSEVVGTTDLGKEVYINILIHIL